MNAPLFSNTHDAPSSLPVAFRSAETATSLEGSSFARQVAVIPGMLSSLDSLSTAGQCYIMAKVVAFIQQQAGRVARGLNLQNQRVFAELVAQLQRESDRVMPDARAFARRAESLLALLSTIS